MEFTEIIACLENTERREEFIARLKKAGETSSPVLHLKNAMTELKMHKAPKGIFEKTMLQNMFRYTDAMECFQSFRLVCKSWKNAIETMRFNRCVGPEIFERLDRMITNHGSVPAYFFDKYLPVFKGLKMHNVTNKNEIFPLVLKNLKKLNAVSLDIGGHIDEQQKSFINQLLQNSHKTLILLHLPTLVLPNIVFPNMEELVLFAEKITSAEFKTNFLQVLQNMEGVKVVEIDLSAENDSLCAYIGENYPNYCMCSQGYIYQILDLMPLKILQRVVCLKDSLENKTHASSVQYLHIRNPNSEFCEWDSYQEIFDQYTNLKEIQLGQNFISNVLPNLSNVEQEIWRERISYFQARGIRLVGANLIFNNKELLRKLAKEAGIKWFFDIY